jgi:hypothetical protein
LGSLSTVAGGVSAVQGGGGSVDVEVSVVVTVTLVETVGVTDTDVLDVDVGVNGEHSTVPSAAKPVTNSLSGQA